jgi:hypothetical protein
MEYHYPTFDEWFASLSAEEQSKTTALVASFKALSLDTGYAGYAEAAARSEVSEGFPQLAVHYLLRSIWRSIDSRATDHQWIDYSVEAASREPSGYFADAGAALARMLALGVTRQELASVARMVAYETAFDVVHRLDEGYDPHGPATDRGWRVVETLDGAPTGRHMDGLHEPLLSLDPSGREGRPG